MKEKVPFMNDKTLFEQLAALDVDQLKEVKE